MKNEFLFNRKIFNMFTFRNLVIYIVLQATAIYLSNPLNIEIFALKNLGPFIASLILTVLFYFLVTKKLSNFCSLAISACVISFVIGTSEFVSYLRREMAVEAWAYYLLGINIQTGCLLLLVTRIRWKESLFMLILVNVYSWVRILDIISSISSQKTAILSLISNVLLLFTIAYSSEHYELSCFKKLKQQTAQLEAFEELIKNVIPSAIIIIKEEEVLFINEGTKKLFGISDKQHTLEILRNLKVPPNEENLEARSLMKIKAHKPTASSFTLLEHIKACEKLLLADFEDPNNFSCTEAHFDKKFKGSHQSYSCHVGATLWKGEVAVIIILSDRFNINNYYKHLDVYKDNLLATVSHNLRTPLNGMLGMLELMVEDAKEATQIERLSVTMASAQLLSSMINDILDFSLIAKGKLRLKYESTNVTTLLEETAKILELQANSKGLKLELLNKLVNKDENHIIDGNRVKQVLLNLIGNAVKFTNKGKVTISVKEDLIDGGEDFSNEELLEQRGKTLEPAGEMQDEVRSLDFVLMKKCLLFEIEDTGVGIKETDFDKLFKLFSKLDNDDKQGQNQGGIGLGLAISQSIVCMLNSNQEGAKITVESKMGKGSKFSFPIFIEKEPSVQFKEIIGMELKTPFSFETKTFKYFNSNDMSPSSKLCSEGDSPLIHEKKETIVLVVDDDPINILVAESYLGSLAAEYRVFTAINGKVALDIIIYNSKNNIFFDIILMDCNMPTMDGYEASEKIKSMIKENLIPYVPIVAITANVASSDKEKCFLHGMDFFLTKPYSKMQLVQTMKEAIRHSY